MERSASPSPRERLLRRSQLWFTDGLQERTMARRERRCVECRRALESRRTPYCSKRCRWKYHGRFFWDAARIFVMRRDRYTCRQCGLRARKRELEVDHIQEIARGGASLEYENLQTLCRRCHREKTRGFLREFRRGDQRVEEILDGPEWFPA